MATRYRTYQYDWGFITIDTKNEEAPEGWTAEFQVNIPEAELIEEGAKLEVIEEELIITPPDELMEGQE